jgi:hypothetical protein
VNSQNRMNAGAEYVLYRIWATLQEREGIHAGSLLTCVGALAGYACQAYLRQAGAPAGVDPREFALVASPLSIAALVRRAVQKIGAPLPDVEGISAYASRALEPNEFVPRAPDEHRARQLPIVYLTQLWPQVLPLARRFCRRPAQLPVLFGIALQRAIEHTTNQLNPTLGASIAMESAVAMSRAVLPGGPGDLFQAPAASPNITITTKPPSPQQFPEIRATKRKRIPIPDPSAFTASSFGARMRSAKGIATLMSLAVIAVVSFSWKGDRPEAPPMTARIERGLRAPTFQSTLQPRETTAEQPLASFARAPQVAPEPAPPSVQQEPLPEEIPQPADGLALPATPPPDNSEGIIADDGQSA